MQVIILLATLQREFCKQIVARSTLFPGQIQCSRSVKQPDDVEWGDMMRRVLSGSLLVVLAAASLLLPLSGSASAFSIGTCPYVATHVWGHQWATGIVYGQYAQMYTYDVSVGHVPTETSLSHIYTYYGSTDPTLAGTWIETGYVKGKNSDGTWSSSEHYYYAWQNSSGGGGEVNPSDAPTIGSTRLYEILFIGHNYSLGTDDWNVYYENLSTVRATLHMTLMPQGHGLAGGEALGDGTYSVWLHTHGVPAQQLETSTGVWKDWNPTNFAGTQACQSHGITVTENTQFTDYEAHGVNP